MKATLYIHISCRATVKDALRAAMDVKAEVSAGAKLEMIGGDNARLAVIARNISEEKAVRGLRWARCIDCAVRCSVRDEEGTETSWCRNREGTIVWDVDGYGVRQ